MLICLITLVSIKHTFNIIKKVCRFNRAYMNSKTVKKFKIVKHYNRKTDRTKNNIFIEF